MSQPREGFDALTRRSTVAMSARLDPRIIDALKQYLLLLCYEPPIRANAFHRNIDGRDPPSVTGTNPVRTKSPCLCVSVARWGVNAGGYGSPAEAGHYVVP